MGLGVLLKPRQDPLVRRIGLHGGRKLVAGDPGELQQPFIHRAGIEILTLRPGQDGSALVDHAREMGISPQPHLHAAGELCSQVHR